MIDEGVDVLQSIVTLRQNDLNLKTYYKTFDTLRHKWEDVSKGNSGMCIGSVVWTLLFITHLNEYFKPHIRDLRTLGQKIYEMDVNDIYEGALIWAKSTDMSYDNELRGDTVIRSLGEETTGATPRAQRRGTESGALNTTGYWRKAGSVKSKDQTSNRS